MGLQEDLVGGTSGESGGWALGGIWRVSWVGLQGSLVGGPSEGFGGWAFMEALW